MLCSKELRQVLTKTMLLEEQNETSDKNKSMEYQIGFISSEIIRLIGFLLFKLDYINH